MKKTAYMLVTLAAIMLTNLSTAQDLKYEVFEKNAKEGSMLGVQEKITKKQILPAIYDNVGKFSEGKFLVVKNGKVGAVDTLNHIVVPIIYDEMTGFSDRRTFVAKGKKWAMVDNKGKVLTAFSFDQILGYQDGVVRVEIAGKTGYLDSLGKYILQCKFAEGYDCHGDFILVYEKSFVSTGYEYVTKDKKGNIVNTQDIGYNGKLPVVFNKKGQIVYKGEQYEKVLYNDGKSVFIVKSGDAKQKVISRGGTELIPYSSGYGFVNTDDWIAIETTTGYGIMSFDGKILWKPNFQGISDYEYRNNELAKVSFKNDEFFYIDKKGVCVEFEGIKCPE
jgi:hypothetical protein